MVRYRGEREGQILTSKAIGGTLRIMRAVNRSLKRASRRRERNAGRTWMIIIVVLLGLTISWCIAGYQLKREQAAPLSSIAPQR